MINKMPDLRKWLLAGVVLFFAAWPMLMRGDEGRNTGWGWCALCRKQVQNPHNCSRGGGGGRSPADIVGQMAPMLQKMIEENAQADDGGVRRDVRQEIIDRLASLQREEMARLSAESARRNAMYDRLNKWLKSVESDADSLKMKGMEPDEVPALAPSGDSFFGLGGGRVHGVLDEEHNDPMVVDLRNYRRASFLACAAENAAPQDQDAVLEEAVKAAQGDTSFIAEPPPGSVPEIDEKGLLEFQRNNIAYANALDSELRQRRAYNEAMVRRELAVKTVAQRKKTLEERFKEKQASEKAAKTDKEWAELSKAALQEYEAWLTAEAEMAAVKGRRFFERGLLLLSLNRAGAGSGKDPTLPSEIVRTERMLLEPSLADRLNHEQAKRAARDKSAAIEDVMSNCFGGGSDPDLEAKASGILTRMRQLSPYPDDQVAVRLYSLPKSIPARMGYFLKEYAKDRELSIKPKSELEKMAAEEAKDTASLASLLAFADSRTIYVNADKVGSWLKKPDGTDKLSYLLGHELAHIQRDHFAAWWGARNRAEIRDAIGELLGADESKWRTEIRTEQHAMKMHDLNYEQEFEAERFGTTLAVAAGAKWSVKKKELLDLARDGTARSNYEEMMADHPAPRRYHDSFRQTGYGPLLAKP